MPYCDHTLHCYDDQNVYTGVTGGTNNIKILPDGKIVSCSIDNKLRICKLSRFRNPKIGTCDFTLHSDTDAIKNIKIFPDGRILSLSPIIEAEQETLKIY